MKYDVFRKTNRDNDVWGKHGEEIDVDSPEEAILRVMVELPDHMLRTEFFAIPSGYAIYFAQYETVPSVRTVSLEPVHA